VENGVSFIDTHAAVHQRAVGERYPRAEVLDHQPRHWSRDRPSRQRHG